MKKEEDIVTKREKAGFPDRDKKFITVIGTLSNLLKFPIIENGVRRIRKILIRNNEKGDFLIQDKKSITIMEHYQPH